MIFKIRRTSELSDLKVIFNLMKKIKMASKLSILLIFSLWGVVVFDSAVSLTLSDIIRETETELPKDKIILRKF